MSKESHLSAAESFPHLVEGPGAFFLVRLIIHMEGTPVDVRTVQRASRKPLETAKGRGIQLTSDKAGRRYLDRLFKLQFNDFSHYHIPEPIADKFTQQMEVFMKRAIAEEFEHPTSFTHEGKTHTSKPLLMFRRPAFIFDILEKSGYEKDTDTYQQEPSFIFLDLKDLYSANMAGAADWMLSSVARKINNITTSFMSEVKRTASSGTCRYGGDEFVVGSVGLTHREMKELQKRLREGIKSMTGFYRNHETGQIEKRPIEVNSEKDHIIEFPEDPVEKKIFSAYMRRSLILDHHQIVQVKELFTQNGQFNDDAFFEVVGGRMEKSIRDWQRHLAGTHPELGPYTQGYAEQDMLKRRIADLLFYEPEVSEIMTLADYIDRKEEAAVRSHRATPISKFHKRKENLVTLLDEVVFDPLLGENVLSIEGIRSQILQGKVDKVMCVDLKFIKEINDAFSYAEGDMAIKALWKWVSGIIPDTIRRDLIISRRGGSFLLGLRRGSNYQEYLNKLSQSVREFDLTFRNKEIRTHLGVSDVIDIDNAKVNTEMAGKVMGMAFGGAEGNWYKESARIIRENPQLHQFFTELQKRLDKGESQDAVLAVLTAKSRDTVFDNARDTLLLRFFFGKPGLRNNQRIDRIMNELEASEVDAERK